MSLYWEGDGIQLWHGDCREVDAWLAADVLVTDPPYGMAYESNRNRDKRNRKLGTPIANDRDTGIRDAALAAWSPKPALVFGKWTCDRPAGTKARLIWDKRVQGTGDLSIPWGPTDEEIYVLGTGFVGIRGKNIISVQMLMSGDSERPNHPTPKPVPLMERLVEHTAGVVADPFAGSGSTLVACRNLGRSAVGVEIHEPYAEVCARRLDQGVLNFEDAS